jgi:predicted small secreted protein
MKKLIIIFSIIAFVIGGFITFWFMSDEGPSRWEAFKTAEEYLTQKYGNQTGSWFVMEKDHQLDEANPQRGAYTLSYTWNGKKGYLFAYYNDYESNPVFTIKEPEPNQSTQTTR